MTPENNTEARFADDAKKKEKRKKKSFEKVKQMRKKPKKRQLNIKSYFLQQMDITTPFFAEDPIPSYPIIPIQNADDMLLTKVVRRHTIQ